MKELSIEEKAKRYDEAIKRANELNYVSDKDSLQRKTVEHIFPELKESEDDRIRKAIKYGLDHVFTNNTTVFGVTKEQCLTWLEKQGNPTVIIPKFRVGDEIKTSNEESLTITKIDEKGYWSEDLFICNFDDADKWKLVEQKPAWSEEDEEMHRKCICAMRTSACGFPEEEKFVEQVNNWLKSLKDRVEPQLKQDWSEENEEIIEKCIGAIRHSCYSHSTKIKVVKFLESLRPQKQWKPSEEQIQTLEYYMHALTCNEHKEVLFGLMEQLKAL